MVVLAKMSMRMAIFGLGLIIPVALRADTLLWTSAGSAWEAAGQPGFNQPMTLPPDNSSLNPANSLSYTGISTNGVDVTATTVGGGTDAYLARMDEAPWVWAGDTLGWVQPGAFNCTQYSFSGGNPTCVSGTSTPYLLTFQGPFNFDTSTTTTYGSSSTDANTALLATADGADPTPIQLTFSQSLTQFGVDISALGTSTFKATLTAYDGAAMVGTATVTANGIGGMCASLDNSPANGGSGCNNAPYISISNLGPITRIILNVQDMSGNNTNFAIDSLQLGGESMLTPEPGVFVLASSGLVALLWWRRRRG